MYRYILYTVQPNSLFLKSQITMISESVFNVKQKMVIISHPKHRLTNTKKSIICSTGTMGPYHHKQIPHGKTT